MDVAVLMLRDNACTKYQFNEFLSLYIKKREISMATVVVITSHTVMFKYKHIKLVKRSVYLSEL